MAGVLWADSPYGLFTFVVITLILGGAGAWAAGRALAQTWRPMPMLLIYMLLLTAGVRFLHYALYGEPLLAPLLVKQIFEVIADLNQREGLTVFLVEQNAFHALRLAHRGYVMVNGEITMQGGGNELLARPEVRAAYLEGGH